MKNYRTSLTLALLFFGASTGQARFSQDHWHLKMDELIPYARSHFPSLENDFKKIRESDLANQLQSHFS